MTTNVASMIDRGDRRWPDVHGGPKPGRNGMARSRIDHVPVAREKVRVGPAARHCNHVRQ